VIKKIFVALAALSMTPSLAHAAPSTDQSRVQLCPVWNGMWFVWKPCTFVKR